MACVGVIKSYGQQKGFGFIACDTVEGDVYFQAKDLPSEVQGLDQSLFQLRGCGVVFELDYKADGKPQAKHIGITSGAGGMDPSSLFSHMYAVAQAQASVAQVVEEPDPEAFVGPPEDGEQRFRGTVKSFNATSGYGFITCPDIGRDVYFKGNDVPPQLQGHNLSGMSTNFTIYLTPDSKVQARNIRFALPRTIKRLSTAMRPSNTVVAGFRASSPSIITPTQAFVGMPSAAMNPMMAAALSAIMGEQAVFAQDGSYMSGMVKSYNEAKKFGFLVAEGLPVDIYFKSEEPYIPGQLVSFTLRWAPDGKPQAQKVSPALTEGDVVTGFIKSYSDKTGYGFIKPESGGQEIYFKTRDLPEGLKNAVPDEFIGCAVMCNVSLQKDGKPVGRNITLMGVGGFGVKRKAVGEEQGLTGMMDGSEAKRPRTAPAPSFDGLVGRPKDGEYVAGIVKSYNVDKGFGFASVDGLPKDVYFKKDSLPEAVRNTRNLAGHQVRFILHYTPDGKPQASSEMEADFFAS